MGNNPRAEVIRRRIQRTRKGLSEKLQALEKATVGQVTETAESVGQVTETVQDTVEKVGESVQDTLKKVKKMIDVPRQVKNYPWAAMAVAGGVGFVVGSLIPSRSAVARHAVALAPPQPTYRPEPPPRAASKPGGLIGFLQAQVKKLSDAALTQGVQALRDLAVKAVPESMQEPVTQFIDQAASHLGVEPQGAQSEEPEEASPPAPEPERKRRLVGNGKGHGGDRFSPGSNI